MDDLELQRRLKGFGVFNGAVNGQLGPDSIAAVNAFLNNGRVAVLVSWTRARRVLAAKQLVCRHDGIEVGAVDGLAGPQTRFAFEVYAFRSGQGPDPSIPGRDDISPTPAGGAQWPLESAVESFFGPIGADQQIIQIPYAMRLSFAPATKVKRVSVHKRAAASALRCFEKIAAAYDEAAREETGIAIFGGGFNVRKKRGGTSWSMHSWGIAFDFDPDRNGLHSTRANARLAQPDCETFWKIWEAEGWLSLGRARNFDWMHVQAARL